MSIRKGVQEPGDPSASFVNIIVGYSSVRRVDSVLCQNSGLFCGYKRVPKVFVSRRIRDDVERTSVLFDA